ncbi:MAG: PAS domain S-box protein, partial [Thermoanaerobaculia bacterium]
MKKAGPFRIDALPAERSGEGPWSGPLLRTIAQNCPDHLMLLDESCRIRFINRAVADLSVEEVIGRTVFELVSEDQRPAMLACFGKIRESGEDGDYRVTSEDPQGRERIFESRVSLTAETASVRGFVVQSRDVTDRQMATRALQKSEQKYRRLFENATDAILMTLPGGRILDANPAAVKLLGLDSREEVLARDAKSFYREPERRGQLLGRLLDAGQLEDQEVDLVDAAGNEIKALVSTRVVRDDEGAAASILAIVHDVTERNQLEQRLQRSQRMEAIGQLAGGVAHDFSNILTVITGHAEILVDDSPPG